MNRVIDPFVDAGWLRATRDDQHRDDVVLADVRWYMDGRSGRAAYEAGHIPGAVFVDMDTVLSEPHTDDVDGRHPLPTPQRFADGLAQLGIGDGDTVIAYDDAGGVIAARLVWLLRAIGHDAALLDGGLQAWPPTDLRPSTSAAAITGAATSTGATPTTPAAPSTRPPKTFTPVPWPPHKLAQIDEVATTTATLIDARDHQRFEGGPDPVDPRSGHIPGAHSVPTREHLDNDQRIASPEQLRTAFATKANIEPGTEVISYCGSGVTACHNLLALERAGLAQNAKLFPGSWSQWSRDPNRPVAAGAA